MSDERVRPRPVLADDVCSVPRAWAATERRNDHDGRARHWVTFELGALLDAEADPDRSVVALGRRDVAGRLKGVPICGFLRM